MSRGRGLRIRVPGKAPLKQDESARHELALQLRTALEAGHTGCIVESDFAFAKEFPGRGWKWDIVVAFDFGRFKLAIEVDGGIWVQGAHAHPVTILRNMEKRNWGARLGWRVLAFTPDQVRDGSALDFVLAVVTNPRLLTVRETLPRGIRAKTTSHARKQRRRR